MKTFIQYLEEMPATKIATHDNYLGSKRIEGHHNPTTKQTLTALKKSKRGLRTLHYKDDEGNHHSFVWNAYDATHDQVMKGEGIHKREHEKGAVQMSGDDKAILTTSHNAAETKVPGKYKTKSHPSGHSFMKSWKHHRTARSGGGWNRESGHSHTSEYSINLEDRK
jgi:hypothetical protein